MRSHHRALAPLLPIAFETLDLSAHDVVISLSASFAKGAITRADQFHLCYICTPTRFLTTHTDEYTQHSGAFRVPGLSYLGKKTLGYLSQWDQVAASRPDSYLAISNLVAQRVKHIYKRTSDGVVYPPVTLLTKETVKKEYLASLSRLVSYKRVDSSILACKQLGLGLVVAGDGPDRARLERLADRVSIRHKNQSLESFLARYTQADGVTYFTGILTEHEKTWLLNRSKLFLHPGLEDFGITPLEAASLGVPSVLHQKSGCSEVLGKDISQHCKETTPSSVADAIEKGLQRRWSTHRLQAAAKTCQKKHFEEEFISNLEKLYQLWQSGQ
ncbi:MAG: glycosyltransferase [Pseudomonadales bacterium]|nr:glycosyltransferase [Candidatus Woesebacteria bacterium]MCB9802160.1 glycosyltransferase [Pseudomonadales bacterium]